jgi:ABC-type transport system involved in multi-copper enzyme maturation permease subunit
MTATIDRSATSDRSATIGVGNLVRAEWTKLRSVRSTYWTGIVAVLATFGLGIGLSIRWQRDITANPFRSDGFDATLTTLNGVYLAQVAIGALGVLVISSEYGTGMIRATLGAVPQRRAMLAAKAAVFAVCTLVVSELSSFLTFGIGQAILHRARVGASLADPGVLRAVIGSGLYLTAVGMLGFGLGALIRHTAGALSAFFGILFALTAVVDLLPTDWRNAIIKYLPANSGSQILTVLQTNDSLAPWTGLGVFCLYALVPIVAAFALITRRDA